MVLLSTRNICQNCWVRKYSKFHTRVYPDAQNHVMHTQIIFLILTYALFLFLWFDFLHLIKNLSVIKGRVLLGWTSTELGLMFLLKDTTQHRWWGSNLRPLCLESSKLPLSLPAPSDGSYHWYNAELFFEDSKHLPKLMAKKIFTIVHSNGFIFLDLCILTKMR